MSGTSAKVLGLVLAATALLAGCERPRPDSAQGGWRGTGMVQVNNPRLAEAKADVNVVPEALTAADQDGPKAGTVYQNVKVLGDLSVAEFTRTMLAMTAWVAPEQGCNYCHNPQNLADDGLYTKVVARRMIQMTKHINTDWKPHVANTGVTCYTCHRGNAVPANVWYSPEARRDVGGMSGETALQNLPSKNVGLAALPYDPYSPFLLGSEDIRVAGMLPVTGKLESTQHTEKTYALMIHMSSGLGVNCTYCHNTRNFQTWDGSTPQRTTAWHGIRMARDLNNAYLLGLTATFPANRLGPTGDVAKVNCTTCHQGVAKPLYGAPMAKAYPALTTAAPAAADAASAPAPAASGATASLGNGLQLVALKK
jgi:photosynthetic reaction center cytochrome c subunit